MPLTLNDLALNVENETGCNERPAIIRSLKDSARDFCIQSESWIIEASLSITPSVTQYSVVGSLSAFVIRVIQVSLTVNDDTIVLPETKYRMADNTNIQIDSDYVKTAGTLKVTVALAPNIGSESAIPELMMIRYCDGIRYGACQKILRQKGRPWYDPNLSEYFGMCCLDEVSRAIADSHNNLEIIASGFSG